MDGAGGGREREERTETMKTRKMMLACVAGLAVTAGLAVAQDDGGRPREGRGDRPGGDRGQGEARGGGPGGAQGMHRPPMGMKPPLIAALDANDDGVIDEKELDQAARSLRKLDRNGDGKLDRQELMPPRPMGPPGGEGGQAGGDRPGRGDGGERRGGREGGERRGPPPPPADPQ